MDKDTVHVEGLTPQGDEVAQPQDAPGEQGKGDTAAQELRKLYKELRKWKDKYRELQLRRTELEEREKALRELKSQLADAHLARILEGAAAAQDAINPEQVAAFLRPRVGLDDELNAVVVGRRGREEGEPGTVEELVTEFLSKYPYHRKAKLSGGSGSAPSPTAVADTLKEQIRSASSHEELEKLVSRKRP
jgi:hypothetical protein